jgi:hypothetical protein
MMDEMSKSPRRRRALRCVFGACLLVCSTVAASAPAAASGSVTLTGPNGTKYQAVVTQVVLQVRTPTTPTILQPALSIYELGPHGRQKVWTAPPSVVPRLQRVSKYPMGWLPLVEVVSSLTAAPLVPDKGQQLVFAVQESAADCGSTSVHVVGLTGDSWHDIVSVQNFCALAFTISGKNVNLTGPGYKSSDPLCCPSTPKATATLSYRNGAWKIVPPIFKLTIPKS